MSTARYMFCEAIDLSDAGDYRKAHKLLTKAIRLDPNNAQAYFERAIVCLNMDQDQQALPDLDRCLELDPHFPGARDWRARALEGTGSLHLAAHERLKSLREHPEGRHSGMGVSPQDWAECAEAFARVGDTETAIALKQRLTSG